MEERQKFLQTQCGLEGEPPLAALSLERAARDAQHSCVPLFPLPFPLFLPFYAGRRSQRTMRGKRKTCLYNFSCRTPHPIVYKEKIICKFCKARAPSSRG